MATLQFTKKRARRRRTGERGAAMVEAVVAIPFFLLIFAATLYVGNLYQTKLTVMRVAKESAWNYATCNCGETGDDMSSRCQPADGPSASGGGSDSASPSGYDPGAISKVGSGTGGEIASKSFGSSQASMEQSITADGFLGGYTKTMSSRTRVMCNEAPHNGFDGGGITSWGASAFDSLSKW
jgi:hypothetical protein